MLNSVVKISMMSAKYFEYYTIILRGLFFRGHTVTVLATASVCLWWLWFVGLLCFNFCHFRALAYTTLDRLCFPLQLQH